MDKMNLKTEIRLGKGIGDLFFGSTRETVKAYLGSPNKINKYSYDRKGEEKGEIWIYTDLCLVAFFDESEDFRLSSLEVNSPNYLLNGISFIGMCKADVLKIVLKSDFGLMEDNNDLLIFDKVSLNMWFEDDILSEIQWGPFWTDDEQIDWPNIIYLILR